MTEGRHQERHDEKIVRVGACWLRQLGRLVGDNMKCPAQTTQVHGPIRLLRSSRSLRPALGSSRNELKAEAWASESQIGAWFSLAIGEDIFHWLVSISTTRTHKGTPPIAETDEGLYAPS